MSVLAALTLVVACDSSGTQKVKPALTVSTETLDFELTAVGDSSFPLSIQLKANTGAPVTLSDLKLKTTSGGEEVFTFDGTPPDTVPARGQIELGVVFSPTAVATYAGELTFKTDDPEKPSVRILLTGEGKSPEVEVTPMEIRLAATACPPNAMSVQCKDEAAVRIENKGLVRLTLPSVTVAPAEGESAVPANLKLANLVNTKTLEPGEKIDVKVAWQPRGNADPSMAQVGDFKARLVITSNDPANPTITVPIEARGNPAGTPTSCVNVLSVLQREYKDGVASFKPVAPTIWLDDVTQPMNKLIHVRPGMKITFTSKRTKVVYKQDGTTIDRFEVDAEAEQANPCTADPTGDPALKLTWTVPNRPGQSRAGVTSKMSDTQGEIEIDAAGEYTVRMNAANSLGLNSSATFAIDAQPRGDLFVELDWQSAPGVDLDLHLLADSGPGLAGAGSPFCTQDCFFMNPNPTWFTNSSGDMIPRFLRDDQGTKEQLESVDLIKAPENVTSSFRVVVHYFDPNGQSLQVKPTIRIRHLSQVISEFTAPSALTKLNDTWFAAKVDFAGDGKAPTVTQLAQPIVEVEPPDLTSGQIPACE